MTFFDNSLGFYPGVASMVIRGYIYIYVHGVRAKPAKIKSAGGGSYPKSPNIVHVAHVTEEMMHDDHWSFCCPIWKDPCA